MEYTYIRTLLLDSYDIDNADLKDYEGNQVYLVNKVQQALGLDCNMVCSGIDCRLIFSTELTSEQKTILDQVVDNYKHGVV